MTGTNTNIIETRSIILKSIQKNLFIKTYISLLQTFKIKINVKFGK